MRKLFWLALAGLGYWTYTIYQDGGNPVEEISYTLGREVKDFKEAFIEGYERGLTEEEKDEEESSVRTQKTRQSEQEQQAYVASYPQDVSKRLELPRPSERSGHYFVVHTLSNGEVNYSLEYDADRLHSRWVAFTFDDNNCQDRVGRMDAWQWDPKLPKKLSTELDFKGSGYSRGHLVASEDRVASKEANKQTFYYSNVSPQLQEHNAGIWKRLEDKVRSWGRNSALRRVLYVAKGGTIKPGLSQEKLLRGRIAVPKYYWMAVLAEDHKGQYHSIAFLTEHRKYERKESNLQKLALSVDELEAFIDLDLFYNLPDELEAEVEAQSPNSSSARRYWWQ